MRRRCRNARGADGAAVARARAGIDGLRGECVGRMQRLGNRQSDVEGSVRLVARGPARVGTDRGAHRTAQRPPPHIESARNHFSTPTARLGPRHASGLVHVSSRDVRSGKHHGHAAGVASPARHRERCNALTGISTRWGLLRRYVHCKFSTVMSRACSERRVVRAGEARCICARPARCVVQRRPHVPARALGFGRSPRQGVSILAASGWGRRRNYNRDLVHDHLAEGA